MRIAILDDYQNVSQSLADWSALDGKADIDVYTEPLGDEDAVAGALAGYNAIVCMRERTPFPASLIARLDNLQLIVTTGMRNRSIDMDPFCHFLDEKTCHIAVQKPPTKSGRSHKMVVLPSTDRAFTPLKL